MERESSLSLCPGETPQGGARPLKNLYFSYNPIDWSGNRRLQREQRELKTPQERSDEEAEAVPAESVRLKRKSMAVERVGLFQWSRAER